LLTRTNLGTSKVVDPILTWRSTGPRLDGGKCLDTLVILSEMKEESMLVSRTMRTLWFKTTTATPGQDGMSDMSRMNRLTNQVSSIQDMDSTATETSTLSPREMADTSHPNQDRS
jgi:hypothetical protein